MKALETVKDVALVLTAVLACWLSYHRSSGGPPPTREPDPAAVKLGGEYAKAVLDAQAGVLEAGAKGPWSTSADAAKMIHEDLNRRLAQASAPLVAALRAKVGPTGDQPLEFGKATELRSFFADVALGIRKAEGRRMN